MLPLGQKRKVAHCSNEPSAYISNEPTGLRLHCFRCGTNDFEHRSERLSAREILALRSSEEEVLGGRTPQLTELHAGTVPSEARVWLLRAGISPEEAEHYGIGYSLQARRVFLPILHNGHATGQWIGRAVDGRKPKYIMSRGSTGAVWYDIRGRDGPCVVVEDVLSAIKVRKSGFDCMAVLGTTISASNAAKLAERMVVGWFDADRAGQKGYVKLRRATAPYGVETSKIVTSKDPKLYSTREIREFIRKHNERRPETASNPEAPE